MNLKVAVLTCTRDRLDYTKHCFDRLRENAGCDYDHYVVDQGSTDGTQEWLKHQPVEAILLTSNMGISKGLNLLLDSFNPVDYDVIVKFDNDCELVQENTLRDITQLTFDGDALLSPRILGLKQPPTFIRELRIDEEIILDIPQIGGIFLSAPAWVYDHFRYSDANPTWGGDDVEICHWFRMQGGTCGYVKRLEAWHYETSAGQEERYGDYTARKRREMAT